MTYQTVLIAFLVILVATLSILYSTRIRREKRLTSALRRMSQSDFSTFLRTNSLEGTIQTVAGQVSEFLKGTFGCQRIIFLRKQRGFLELNYYHGIRSFKRQEFKLRFSQQLAERLKGDFLPRSLDDLRDVLPDSFRARVQGLGLDMFFPIFWRDNLYGIYFIKSTLETARVLLIT